MTDFTRVRIHAIEEVGDPGQPGATRIFDLRPHEASHLASFAAGAHIDVRTPGDEVRQYSLCNDPAETHRYVIAVLLEAQSRGGSHWLHHACERGDTLEIGAPRSLFPLVEDAPFSVLIAGGIGITPIWAMAQRLIALERPFALHFGARSRRLAPLLETIETTLACTGTPYFASFADAGQPTLDFAQIRAQAPANAHFYACGPAAMLEAYGAALATLPAERVHHERFANCAPAARTGGFEVELARSGRTFRIEEGQTILEVLKAAGIRAPFSCAQGVCGACEATILDGRADHRDAVLSEAERTAGQTMMICCSGALTPRLVLDL